MLLQSLRLKNFRQYKGEQIIHFSTDPQKNVTVILGKNTFGKTTLLQAFNWCFYQKVQLDNPDQLLNYDVAENLPNGGAAEVLVEISLIHNSVKYTITTMQEYTRTGATVKGQKPNVKLCYEKEDGQTEPVKPERIRGAIQSILPEDLSEFFFFDTERVANVGESKDLTQSVKSILGLSVLDEALHHIGDQLHKGTVLGKFYLDLDLEGDDKAREALESQQAAQEKSDEIKKRLEECRSQIEKLRTRKEQLDELLRDNEETRELQKRKARLEQEVEKDTAAVEKTENALRRDFSKSSIEYFIVPLLDQAEEVLKDADIDDKGIKGLTRLTLEEIINRGTCVCGLDLSSHPEAIEHIKQEMKYCPPESIGTAVRNYCDDLHEQRGNQDDILASLQERQSTIIAALDRIQNNDEMIDELSAAIEQKGDLSSLESERNVIKNQLKTLETRREELVRDDERQKQIISQLQRTYDQLSVASQKNKQTMRYIAYAEEIHRWLDETYREKEREVREALQARVNDIFEQMYHGTRKVLIDSKYHVELLTSTGGSEYYTGESEGLNRVKSFAFIAGLVSLAKERIVAGDQDFDLSSEPYPLVMDAPFSNTDEVHIANISRVLPEASEQVIMFVMQKDWNYAEPVLGDKVGARYMLDKKSEQYSVLEES